MGKGKRAAFRAIGVQDKKRKAEIALLQVAQIADKMCINPTAMHDFALLKEQLEVLYTHSNLSGASKDVRESFNSIFKTTTAVVDMAIKEEGKREASILDRKPRY